MTVAALVHLLRGKLAADIRGFYTTVKSIISGGERNIIDRAIDRTHRAALTSLISLVARFASLAVTLFTVPLTLRYLGLERYGLWLAMSSTIAMLSFTDLGLGNGLLNAVSRSYGKDDYLDIRRYVTSGLFALLLIAAVLLFAFVAVYGVIPWSHLFGVTSFAARNEAGPAVACLVLCTLVAIPTGVVQRVQFGMQRGFLAGMWQCVASVATVFALLAVIHFHGGLPILVLALAGTPVLVGVLNFFMFFYYQEKIIAPAVAFLSRSAIGSIARTGALFFVLQLAVSVCYTSDNLVLARILGASRVPEYGVPEKLFTIISTLIYVGLSPLWPAYAEAKARGDNSWSKKAITRSTSAALAFSTFSSLTLIVAAPVLIRVWVGGAVRPSFSLLVALGLWKIVESGGTAVAIFLNGTSVVKMQIWVSIATSIANITIGIVLTRRIGPAGVVWGSFLSYLLITIPTYIWYLKCKAFEEKSDVE